VSKVIAKTYSKNYINFTKQNVAISTTPDYMLIGKSIFPAVLIVTPSQHPLLIFSKNTSYFLMKVKSWLLNIYQQELFSHSVHNKYWSCIVPKCLRN